MQSYASLIAVGVGVLLYLITMLFMNGVGVKQFEQTMGDGTKVSCFVTVGLRTAAMSCIPQEVIDDQR